MLRNDSSCRASIIIIAEKKHMIDEKNVFSFRNINIITRMIPRLFFYYKVDLSVYTKA